jgi:hypothetical protein
MNQDDRIAVLNVHDVFEAIEVYAESDSDFRQGLHAARFGNGVLRTVVMGSTFEQVQAALRRLLCKFPPK